LTFYGSIISSPIKRTLDRITPHSAGQAWINKIESNFSYPVGHKKESQPEEGERKVEIKRKIKVFDED
jgi:hypothetical protein